MEPPTWPIRVRSQLGFAGEARDRFCIAHASGGALGRWSARYHAGDSLNVLHWRTAAYYWASVRFVTPLAAREAGAAIPE